MSYVVMGLGSVGLTRKNCNFLADPAQRVMADGSPTARAESNKSDASQGLRTDRFGQRFDARRFVGGGSDDAEFETFWDTDIALEDFAHLQAYTDGNSRFAVCDTSFVDTEQSNIGIV